MTGLAAPASAQREKLPDGVTKGVSIEGINEYRLANGLQVLLIPDNTKPNVTVNITYKVGSRHEGYGETGMAHLLEHMVFKGTPKYGNIPAELTKRGMAPNATTSLDRTNYFATFAPTGDNLEFYLDLEADRMTNSFIAKKDLDSEMTVVRNEMESGENNALRILLQRVLATAFQWHNYGNTTIGARSDIENVRIENLQAFYRKYYQPDNATLTVAGSFDEQKTLDLIAKKYGAITKPERILEPTWTTDPPQDGERTVNVRRVGNDQYVMVGYHIPSASDPDLPAAVLLGSIIGEAPTGRLYKALIETKKAVSVQAGADQFKEPGYMLMLARLNREQSADVARDAIIETAEKFAAEPPSEEEVERARTTQLRLIERTMNDPSNLAFALNEWIARGDWRLMFVFRERLKNVTASDIQRVAKNHLIQSNRTVGKFIPTEKPMRAPVRRYTDAEIGAMAADIKGGEAVAAGEVFDSSPANIESRTKRGEIGGIKYAFLPKKTRANEVNLQMQVNWGSIDSLKGLNRVATITGGLLDRGTQKRSRGQIRDEFTRLNSNVRISGGLLGAGGSIATTRQNLAATLLIVAEMLKEPAFSESEFDQVKTQVLTSLEAQKGDPQATASRAMRLAFSKYPKGHPRFVPTLEEEIEEVRAVTLDSVKKFHKDFYGASSGEIAIVGDFDEQEIAALLQELFGNWRSAKPFTRVPQDYFDIAKVDQRFETPDKANAVFLARQSFTMMDSHPDYPALVLANSIFGGGFLNSRLATRIRQKEGLSYSIGSSLSANAQDPIGNFFVQAIYAPENRDRFIAAFRDEMEKALTVGFTAEEVEQAKQGWLLGRQRQRGLDSALAAGLVSNLDIDRTLAWDVEFEERVKALTTEQVNAAFRKHLSLDKISIFIAGDFAKAARTSGQ